MQLSHAFRRSTELLLVVGKAQQDHMMIWCSLRMWCEWLQKNND